MTSTRHEPVYHATHGCQGKRSGLTAARWRGLFWACQVESQKNAGFLAHVERDQHNLEPLSGFACMLPLRLLKGGGLIAAAMGPQGKDDPDPHIGKCPHGNGMAFAFRSFALIIVFGPGFALRRLPGELIKRVAQGFHAAQSAMRFGGHAALIEHGGGSPQGLQTASRLIARPVIADLGKQPWSQAASCTWQALKDGVILMGQKKGGDLLVILSDLFHERHQLAHQGLQQARFRTDRGGISLQLRLTHLLGYLACDLRRLRVLGLPKQFLALRRGGRSRCSGGWIRLQEAQGALLLQFSKQLQCHRIIGFQTSRELIDQAGLHLHQRVLLAREQLEFSDLFTIGDQAMQIRQLCTSRFRQQVRINEIGRGLPRPSACDQRCED